MLYLYRYSLPDPFKPDSKTAVKIPLQKWLSNLINYFDAPAVYVKHVCYVNFTQ